MVIASKLLYALHYKSRFGLLQGGSEKVVCGMHAYGEHKTGREGNRGGYEQRVSEKERGEHMDTGESEECAGIWWKSEEYFDERESDTEESEEKQLERNGR